MCQNYNERQVIVEIFTRFRFEKKKQIVSFVHNKKEKEKTPLAWKWASVYQHLFSDLQPMCRIWNQVRKSIVQPRVRIMNLYKKV